MPKRRGSPPIECPRVGNHQPGTNFFSNFPSSNSANSTSRATRHRPRRPPITERAEQVIVAEERAFVYENWVNEATRGPAREPRPNKVRDAPRVPETRILSPSNPSCHRRRDLVPPADGNNAHIYETHGLL